MHDVKSEQNNAFAGQGRGEINGAEKVDYRIIWSLAGDARLLVADVATCERSDCLDEAQGRFHRTK